MITTEQLIYEVALRPGTAAMEEYARWRVVQERSQANGGWPIVSGWHWPEGGPFIPGSGKQLLGERNGTDTTWTNWSQGSSYMSNAEWWNTLPKSVPMCVHLINPDVAPGWAVENCDMELLVTRG